MLPFGDDGCDAPACIPTLNLLLRETQGKYSETQNASLFKKKSFEDCTAFSFHFLDRTKASDRTFHSTSVLAAFALLVMATPDVSVHMEEVVVVTTPDNVDGSGVEEVKTVLVTTNLSQHR